MQMAVHMNIFETGLESSRRSSSARRLISLCPNMRKPSHGVSKLASIRFKQPIRREWMILRGIVLIGLGARLLICYIGFRNGALITSEMLSRYLIKVYWTLSEHNTTRLRLLSRYSRTENTAIVTIVFEPPS
jgi:hypothetical protein